MSKHQKLSGILIVLGLLIVGTGLFWSQLSYLKSPPAKKLAWLQRESGNVQVFRQTSQSWQNVGIQDQLFERDMIQTNDLGEAKIYFPNGSIAKVLHDSLVVLERGNESNVSLVIRQGDIRALHTPESESQVLILKNGEEINLVQYNDSILANEKTVALSTPTTTPGLNEKEVTDVLQSKRGSFFKCYAQLLQKNPELKGEVNIGMTIDPTGKVNSVFLTSKTLTEDSFKRCLADIIQQIEFRPFSGEPMSARLPLKFE